MFCRFCGHEAPELINYCDRNNRPVRHSLLYIQGREHTIRREYMDQLTTKGVVALR